jgi:hypothetical protein
MFVEAVDAFAHGRREAEGSRDVGAAGAAGDDELLRDVAAIDENVADCGSAAGERLAPGGLAEDEVEGRGEAGADRLVALLEGAVVSFVEFADAGRVA